jgi:hypothetical protein
MKMPVACTLPRQMHRQPTSAVIMDRLVSAVAAAAAASASHKQSGHSPQAAQLYCSWFAVAI